MIHRLVFMLATPALAGCGIITIASSPPALTPRSAQTLVQQYYNSCHEQAELGQCADMLATQGDYYHLSVAPALRDWVRIQERPEGSNSSLGSPPQKVAVLTPAGAQHCISMFGTSERAGAEAAGCSWLYAPASVTVRRIDQHNGIASVAAVVHFAPKTQMTAYIAASGVGAPLHSLAAAQGRTVHIHLEYDSREKRWIVGDRNAIGHTFVLVLCAVLAIALLAGFGLFRRDESTPVGSGPVVGYLDDVSKGP